jgi:uncharacterized membrane protein
VSTGAAAGGRPVEDSAKRRRNVSIRWDGYPYILLNLAFSTQAAYAAPLILLAQTRQADRDTHQANTSEQTRSRQEERHTELLEQNERLIKRIETLAEEIRRSVE